MRTRTLKIIIILLLIPFLFGCNERKTIGNADNMKKEIMKTEKEFEAATKRKGIAEAFYFYADEWAVIKRANDTLIKGNENIKRYYENPVYENAEVNWAPDFVDVSLDGTIGYTYGKYHWIIKDTDGKETEYKGVFHTVWKKQSDGSWKYVWD